MKGQKFIAMIALAIAGTVIAALPAQAQALRTWVAGNGSDSNPCSYTAPCKTFAGAYTNTAAGGEIDAIDAGGYGTLTISKNLTIDGGGGAVVSTLNSGSVNGFTINGSGIVVTLRNISIDGAGSGSAGISFSNGASLTVVNCEIQSDNLYGLIFAPTVAGARLVVLNTTIHNNPGYGMVLGPTSTSGTSTRVTLDGVKITGSGIGMRVTDNTLVTASRSSISSNSFDGISVATTTTGALVSLEHTTVANNGGNGMSASATGSGHSVIRISNDYISGNSLASMSIGAGGDVISFVNNEIVDNGTNTAPSGTLTPQ